VPESEREKKITEWIARGKTPKIVEETQEDRDRSAKADKEYNDIVSVDIDANILTSVQRYE
jgi:hypothetical protein